MLLSLHLVIIFITSSVRCVEHDINGNDVIVFLNKQTDTVYHNTRVSLFKRHLISQLPTNQPPVISKSNLNVLLRIYLEIDCI